MHVDVTTSTYRPRRVGRRGRGAGWWWRRCRTISCRSGRRDHPSRNPTVTLLQAIRRSIRRGIREPARRGEGPRQGAGVQLPRRVQWDPGSAAGLLERNGRHHKGEEGTCPGLPLSTGPNSTSGPNIGAEQVRLPSIYFAHRRKVFQRDGMLLAVHRHMQPRADRPVFGTTVRFRTVGDTPGASSRRHRRSRKSSPEMRWPA